jgi:hypothetical protein
MTELVSAKGELPPTVARIPGSAAASPPLHARVLPRRTWHPGTLAGCTCAQRNPRLVRGNGLATLAELVVWVQSDRDEARRRVVQRDVGLGRTPKEAESFWDEWMRAEEPFLVDDRPWSRALSWSTARRREQCRPDSVLAPGPLDA